MEPVLILLARGECLGSTGAPELSHAQLAKVSQIRENSLGPQRRELWLRSNKLTALPGPVAVARNSSLLSTPLPGDPNGGLAARVLQIDSARRRDEEHPDWGYCGGTVGRAFKSQAANERQVCALAGPDEYF